MRLLVAATSIGAGQRPIPLDLIRAIRLLGSGEDPLMPKMDPVLGSVLADAFLSWHLKDDELGTWALGPRSLGIVLRTMSTRRPRLTVEFGSGVSTVALAWAASRLGPNEGVVRVVSFEQDASHADHTRQRLRHAGLDGEALVVVAPLAKQRIEGLWTTCYALPDNLHAVLGARKAEFALVDGPAAEAGARFGTIPLISSHMEWGSPFLLDDALRDGELEIAQRWRRLPYVRVTGVRIVEKGMLMGTVWAQMKGGLSNAGETNRPHAVGPTTNPQGSVSGSP